MTGSVLQYIKDHFLGKKVTEGRSPAGNWLGFTLEKIEKGKAEFSLTIKKEMTNPYGNIHGGMMSTIMDEAIGWAVISLDMESHYTSMNLNVDFLYAARLGEQIRARSQVIRSGKKIVHAECAVYDMEDRLLAKASSNLIVTSMKIVDDKY